MRRYTFRNLSIFAALLLSVSCKSIKPYEKELLLGPLMDDASVGELSGSHVRQLGIKERLATGITGGSSTACPTCGG